jgi:hypothetical protein
LFYERIAEEQLHQTGLLHRIIIYGEGNKLKNLRDNDLVQMDGIYQQHQNGMMYLTIGENKIDE